MTGGATFFFWESPLLFGAILFLLILLRLVHGDALISGLLLGFGLLG